MGFHDEMREAIRSSLQVWQAEGVERPVVPLYSDVDGDGVPDFYGLDDDGALVLVSGDDLEGRTNVETLDERVAP